MRKLIIGLALAAGCRSAATMAANPPGPTGSVTGASTERGAVLAFLAAVKTQNLKQLAAVWGSRDGPVTTKLSGDELQRRELIMLCYLKHDTATIVSNAPTLDGDRTFAVEMRYGPIEHTGEFQVARAKDGRYYVERVVNFVSFEDVCAAR